MNRTRLQLLSTLCAVVLCGGCASMTNLEPLGVTLVNIKPGEVTVFETSLEAEIRITNPNPEALSVEGAAFKLYLDGGKVGTGVSNEVFTVERLDSYVVKTTIRLNNAAALLRLRNIFEQNEIEYGVKTTLYTPGPFGTRKVKAAHEGVLDLSTMSNDTADHADDLSAIDGS